MFATNKESYIMARQISVMKRNYGSMLYDGI